MILSGISRRTLSWGGAGVVVGLAAVVLPLMPTLAGDPPPHVHDAHTDFLLASEKAQLWWKLDPGHPHAHHCAACHQMDSLLDTHKVKPKGWDSSHKEVVRLMLEVKVQRQRLQQTEERLRIALDRLGRATRDLENPHAHPYAKTKPAAKPAPKARPAPNPAEERMKALEKKLDALLREVDSLRKEVRPRKRSSPFGRGGFGSGSSGGFGGAGKSPFGTSGSGGKSGGK